MNFPWKWHKKSSKCHKNVPENTLVTWISNNTAYWGIQRWSFTSDCIFRWYVNNSKITNWNKYQWNNISNKYQHNKVLEYILYYIIYISGLNSGTRNRQIFLGAIFWYPIQTILSILLGKRFCKFCSIFEIALAADRCYG